MAKEITKVEAAPMAVTDPTIEVLVAEYVKSGKPIEEAGKLFELFEKMQALKAKKDFNQALRKFQAECPNIVQKTENSQFKKVTHKGNTRYATYASLDDIASTIRGPLESNGLSYRWGDATMMGEPPNERMSVPCVLLHDGGHTESSSFPIPVESKAGSSKQQQWASASTYARRYSLIQALGLTTTENDNDGNEIKEPPQSEPAGKITADQANDLNDMIIQKGAKKDILLGHYKVGKLSELSDVQFKEAMFQLGQRHDSA